MELGIAIFTFCITVFLFPFVAVYWIRAVNILAREIKSMKEPGNKPVVEVKTEVEQRMDQTITRDIKRAEEAIPAAAWVGSPDAEAEAQAHESQVKREERNTTGGEVNV